MAIVATLILMIGFCDAKAQGCSDAGFCTVPELKPHGSEQQMKLYGNRIGAGFAYGLGDEDVTVLTPYLSYSHQFCKILSASAKMTYSSASGELGDHAGLGDLFVDGSYMFHRDDRSRWMVTAGVKLPLAKADAGDEDISLPMDYQSTLESFDLLVAVSGSFKQFGMMLGLQQPLTGENSNSFLPGQYPDSKATEYLPSNFYTRKGDLLARLSYSMQLANDQLILTPSLLPIIHLENDIYENSSGMEFEIDGSQGLTLNANLSGVYNFSQQQSIEISLASPLATRDARPDGLTRSFAMGVEYRVAF